MAVIGGRWGNPFSIDIKIALFDHDVAPLSVYDAPKGSFFAHTVSG